MKQRVLGAVLVGVGLSIFITNFNQTDSSSLDMVVMALGMFAWFAGLIFLVFLPIGNKIEDSFLETSNIINKKFLLRGTHIAGARSTPSYIFYVSVVGSSIRILYVKSLRSFQVIHDATLPVSSIRTIEVPINKLSKEVHILFDETAPEWVHGLSNVGLQSISENHFFSKNKYTEAIMRLKELANANNIKIFQYEGMNQQTAYAILGIVMLLFFAIIAFMIA